MRRRLRDRAKQPLLLSRLRSSGRSRCRPRRATCGPFRTPAGGRRSRRRSKRFVIVKSSRSTTRAPVRRQFRKLSPSETWAPASSRSRTCFRDPAGRHHRVSDPLHNRDGLHVSSRPKRHNIFPSWSVCGRRHGPKLPSCPTTSTQSSPQRQWPLRDGATILFQRTLLLEHHDGAICRSVTTADGGSAAIDARRSSV